MSSSVLALGASYFEINSTNFPLLDVVSLETETVGSEYTIGAGGSAVNFTKICSALGMSPVFIGKRGDDELGEKLEQVLKDSGVTPSFIVEHGEQTNIALNFVRSDGRTLMFVSGSANKSLRAEEADAQITDNLSRVQYLYLGGGFKLTALLPVYIDIINKAKEANVKVVIDHGRVNPQVKEEELLIMKKAISLADYYFPSKDELLEVWGGADISEGLKEASKNTKALIAVKDSESGAYSMKDGELIKVDSFAVTPINTVGAGDSFNAGFIRAQVDGLDLTQSLRFACATAALKISQKELPTYDKINTLCKTS